MTTLTRHVYKDNLGAGRILACQLRYRGCTENTRHPTNAGLMLVHRLRRWPNINPTLVGCLVFADLRHLFAISLISTLIYI